MRSLALAVLMSLVGAAVVAQPAAAQGTLAGEIFGGDPVLTEVECNEGGTSTFKFTSEGMAGPTVPGTYHETGTAKVGPQAEHPDFAIIVGDVLDVQARFEIRSATGEVLVTGHKRLTEPLPAAAGSVGACFTAPGETNPFAGLSVTNLCYHARFTATGETEQGTSLLGIEKGVVREGGPQISAFVEVFFPSETVTCEPPLPELKEECKAGGAFADSALFKNQGDCVAFVATDGKNEPQKNQRNP